MGQKKAQAGQSGWILKARGGISGPHWSHSGASLFGEMNTGVFTLVCILEGDSFMFAAGSQMIQTKREDHTGEGPTTS